MIAWINITILIFSSLFFLYYYVKSVSPAALEKVIGPQAYAKCGRDRVIAIVFELITVASYVIYFFYPLPSRYRTPSPGIGGFRPLLP